MSKRHDIQEATGRVEFLSGRGNVQVWGTGAPSDGKSGYAPGCIYHRVDGGAGTSFYVNEGTNISSTWIAVGSVAHLSSIVLDDSAADNTITISTASDEAANRTLTIPALGGNKTLALIDLAQTVSGAQTFTGGVTVTTTAVTLTDVNIVLSATTGTKIGTATTQKLGFYGATPAAQPSAYTQTYSTADKTHDAPTAATLTVADGAGTNDGTIGAITTGGASADQSAVIAAVQELADQINKLVADMADTKQLVNSVIDDLQALGLVG